MTIALNQPSKNILVALINERNGKNFAVGDLVFGTPTPVGDVPDYNTTILVNLAAKPESKDSISLWYNRIDLGEQFSGKVVAVVDTGAFNTTDDFLAHINTTYGYGLAAADIVVSPVVIGAKPYPVIVRVKPDCLIFKGQFEIQVVDTVVDPTPDIGSYNQTLGPAFQNFSQRLLLDGVLLDGHFRKFIATANGTITAMRGRSAAGPQAPSMPGGTLYDLTDNVTSIGGDWFVDYAMQFDMTMRRGHVTDYYDIQLSIGEAENLRVFTLEQTNGVFSLVNDSQSIPVNYVYERGRQMQGTLDLGDICTHGEFAGFLSTGDLNEDGAPYNTVLTFTLEANRKGDAGDRHQCSITAGVPVPEPGGGV